MGVEAPAVALAAAGDDEVGVVDMLVVAVTDDFSLALVTTKVGRLSRIVVGVVKARMVPVLAAMVVVLLSLAPLLPVLAIWVTE